MTTKDKIERLAKQMFDMGWRAAIRAGSLPPLNEWEAVDACVREAWRHLARWHLRKLKEAIGD